MGQHLQHITDLAEILFVHNIEDVVISPGSRNAPLIRAFFNCFGEKCRSLVDERSAAYFALGQSLISGKPTTLISTSGTAVLNYAPAIAEAFYQNVPLLILTADRPPEWIGQQDNQAIKQTSIYGNYCKASYTLPTEITCNEDLWYSHRIINEAIHKAVSLKPGPVHINIPLREPLYDPLPDVSKNIRIIQKEEPVNILQKNSLFFRDWENAKSILLVCGQLQPDNEFKTIADELSKDPRVVLVAEPISNLHEVATISNPEVVFNSKIAYPEKAIPELVIYFGGQVVSKKIKLILRGLTKSKFWFISPEEEIIDTFKNINAVIHAEPKSVLKDLKVKSTKVADGFKNFWEKENKHAAELTGNYTKEISYSDLQVFKILSKELPENALIFAGNSNVVRYLMYFDQKQRKFYANRGVSGIDGCLSTAAGLASKVDETVFAIVGDLAFTYDSNALWNRDFPKNLKIILVNNDGGGIFHLLKGPSESEDFLPFVNAHHPVDFRSLTEAYGLKYELAANEIDVQRSIQNLVSGKSEATVLEIKTPNFGEPQITKDFFKYLNKNYEAGMEND